MPFLLDKVSASQCQTVHEGIIGITGGDHTQASDAMKLFMSR